MPSSETTRTPIVTNLSVVSSLRCQRGFGGFASLPPLAVPASTPDAGTAKGGKEAKPPQPRCQRRLLTTLKFVTIGVLVVSLLGIGVVAVAYQRTNLPDPNAAFLTNKSNVYYNDGTTVPVSYTHL